MLNGVCCLAYSVAEVLLELLLLRPPNTRVVCNSKPTAVRPTCAIAMLQLCGRVRRLNYCFGENYDTGNRPATLASCTSRKTCQRIVCGGRLKGDKTILPYGYDRRGEGRDAQGDAAHAGAWGTDVGH